MNNNQLQEIQETINKIFLKNINFFKTYEPNILKKLEVIDTLKLSNYSLEFVNNHFDILHNNKLFYNEDPFVNAKKRVSQYTDELAIKFYRQTPLNIYPKYENELDGYDLENRLLINSNFEKVPIYKFIFLGSGLGVHLNDFSDFIDAKNYLLIEDNIEIFHLSLFLTDYEIISKSSKIVFCIDENCKTKEKIINSFLSNNFEQNIKIGFELINENYLKDFEKILQISNDLKESNYPYSEYIMTLNRTYKYLKSNKYININKNRDILESYDTLYISAGPSLAKNIEQLYLYQDYFLIVSAAASLKRLELLNIKPDIILITDGQKDVILSQLDVNKELYKDSIFFVTTKLDPLVYEKIKETQLYFFQSSLEIYNDVLISGSTVGDIGIKLLLNLGVKNLYLLGIDAALDSKSGKTHDGLHNSSKKADLENKKDIYWVKGNFTSKVPTTKLYLSMIKDINDTLENFDSKIYNISNGAYFEKSIPIKFCELNNLRILGSKKLVFRSENFESLKKEIKNDLKKEKKILKNLFSKNIEELEENIKKEKRKYKNSIIIQIIEKFVKLVSVYEKNKINQDIINQEIYNIFTHIGNIYNKGIK